MLQELTTNKKIVGVKQVQKAIAIDCVKVIYFAEDAEERVTRHLKEECQAKNIQMISVPSMKDLGKACGIDVGAAVAAVLTE